MISKESQFNFDTMIRAASNDDVAVVSCKDSKGRVFEVLCVVAEESSGDYAYLPFGMMINTPLHSLMNKIKPPENLKGTWYWDE